jgi:hypothetical protein
MIWSQGEQFLEVDDQGHHSCHPTDSEIVHVDGVEEEAKRMFERSENNELFWFARRW